MNRRIIYGLLALALLAGEVCRHWPVDVETSAGRLEAVLVEESAQRSPALGKLVTAPAVRKAIADRRIAWAFVPESVSGPDAGEIQWALDEAKKYPKPVLVLRHGSRIEHLSPPKTPEALAALLTKKSF